MKTKDMLRLFIINHGGGVSFLVSDFFGGEEELQWHRYVFQLSSN